jgi:hypothetical protein
MTDQTGPVQGGNCAGLDAQSCSTHDDCIAIHANACAGDSNSDPLPPDGLVETCLGVFSECAGESNSADPGTCYGEVLCDGPVPECPPDTLPGVKDGCYTGFCIPVAQCESQPACAAIAAEMACVGRSDCTPLYEGIDCTCDAAGCTCNDWQFESCTANSP